MKKLLVFLSFVVLGVLGCESEAAYKMSREPNASAIKEAIRRTVFITINDMGSCTGVVLETDIVLTAKHCLGPNMKVNGRPATELRSSEKYDLALLKVVTGEFLPLPINTEPSEGIKVFEVFIHADYGRLVSIGRVNQVQKEDVVHDAVAIPGFSGSGLYDRKGRLIGLNNILKGAMLPNGAPIVAFGSAVHPKLVKEFWESK